MNKKKILIIAGIIILVLVIVDGAIYIATRNAESSIVLSEVVSHLRGGVQMGTLLQWGLFIILAVGGFFGLRELSDQWPWFVARRKLIKGLILVPTSLLIAGLIALLLVPAMGNIIGKAVSIAEQVVVEKIVVETVIVEREVPVEKPVVETVMVEKEVEVTKVVKETVIVEKEKVVTATPLPATVTPTRTMKPNNTTTPTPTVTIAPTDTPVPSTIQVVTTTAKTKWVEVAFEPAGNVFQTFNVVHNPNQVTLAWFNVSVESAGNWQDLGVCSLFVITDPNGARIKTNGAYRTFEKIGDEPTEVEIEKLAADIVTILEVEPRGLCAEPGAYNVIWQNAASTVSAIASITTTAKVMTPAAPATTVPAEAKWDEGEFIANPNASSGQPNTIEVTLAKNQVAVVWWNAHLPGESGRDPREFLVLTKSAEVTYEGAIRFYAWSGSEPPTKQQVIDLAEYFAALLKSDDGQDWSFRIVD
jgi:hypothetical protein